MELNITKFFTECTARDYFSSIAEIGQDAGADTWRAACDDSLDYPILDTDEKREAFREYIADFGAWDAKEIAGMTNLGLNALCLQMISGDMREAGLDVDAPDWAAYEADENLVHRLFKRTDGQIYFYIGH